MKTETSLYVCHDCIGDKVLAEQVEKRRNRAKCSYCSSKKPTEAMAELSSRIHQVVKEHYEPNPIFLQTPSDERTDGFLSYCSDNFFDTKTVIAEVAKLDPQIADDVREFLFSLFAKDVNASVAGYNPYHPHMLYQEREGDPSEFRLAWWEFKNEIQHRARFFSTTATDRLGEIFAELDSLSSWWVGPAIREIKPGDIGSRFWRGRTFYSGPEMEEVPNTPAQEIGPPPESKARAGRMNADGIPVFYGALEKKTCLAEIRAPVGSFVVLGEFELLSQVRILDLRTMLISEWEVSHFDPKYSENRSREKFLREWVDEISRPVMPHDEAREYLASQAVADYLANRMDLEIDGMIFQSSQTGGTGQNIVLFNHACRVEADDPDAEPGIRVKYHRQPIIPAPGANPSRETTVQTTAPSTSSGKPTARQQCPRRPKRRQKHHPQAET